MTNNQDFFDSLDNIEVKDTADKFVDSISFQPNAEYSGELFFYKEAKDYLEDAPEYLSLPSNLSGSLFVIQVQDSTKSVSLLALYNNNVGYVYDVSDADSFYFFYKDPQTKERVRKLKKKDIARIKYEEYSGIDKVAEIMMFDSSLRVKKFLNEHGVDFNIDPEKLTGGSIEHENIYGLEGEFETTPDDKKKEFILNLDIGSLKPGELSSFLKLLKNKYSEVLFSINQTDLRQLYFDWIRKEPLAVTILSLRDLTNILRPEDLISFSKIVRHDERFIKLIPELKTWAIKMSSMLEDDDFPEEIIANFTIPEIKAPKTHYLSASEMVQRIQTNPSDLNLLKNKENYNILINSRSENAYTIILSLLEEFPQMIKYLKPLDQKVEFQKIALNSHVQYLKDIYLPDFDLVMNIIDNHISKEIIDCILYPKQWESESTRNMLGSNRELHYGVKSPNLKGTTPRLWTEEEFNKFKSTILSKEPWMVEYFPPETITSYDQEQIVKTMYNNKAKKTDYVNMVSILRNKGLKPTAQLVSMVMN